jgi:hypothetical protein
LSLPLLLLRARALHNLQHQPIFSMHASVYRQQMRC